MSHRRRSLENGLWNALWQSLGDGKACGTRRRRRRMWKARHRRLGGEQLEKRELLAVYDSFNVSSLGGTVNSARILEAYTDYTVNVSGFVYIQNAQSRLADAEYFEVWDSVNKRKTSAWADSSSISGLDIGVRLSQVNNATKWGPRKADGNYSQTVAGIGQPLQAKFVDAPYTDNSGQFSVKVHTYVPVSVAAYDPVAKEEGRDPGTFRITRGGSARYPLTVSFRLSGASSDGTADYTSSATTTVTFGEWESEADVTITPFDDATIETSESVTLTLESSEKYDVVSSDAAAIVTIEDNDNNAPVAVDDVFEQPAPDLPYVDIDVLANDYDADGDDLTIQSVTGPTDGGTAEIITDHDGKQLIRYTPPDEIKTDDPTRDIFPGSVHFSYLITDEAGAAAQAEVRADAKLWNPWREYSRGNDDPRENIYETGQIRVELVVDLDAKQVKLKYTAKSTTDSFLRWKPGATPPEIENVSQTPQAPGARTEYAFYQPYLFLQPAAIADGSAPVTGDAPGVGLLSGRAGAELFAEVVVATWNGDAPNALSGEAVIQMRVPDHPVLGKQVAPFAEGDSLYYGNVRQTIPWSVDIVQADGHPVVTAASLDVSELPFEAIVPGENGVPPESPFAGRVVTPLRIVDSSNDEGMVYKLPYPDKDGAIRIDYNPRTREADDFPGRPGDQRAESPDLGGDWETLVKASEKP